MEEVVFFLISALCLVAIVAFAKRRLNKEPPPSLTDDSDGIFGDALFSGGSDCSSHSHGSHDHGSHHGEAGAHHGGFDGGHFDAGGHH